ncbi:MAG: nodulation protein NfeD [Acidobacteria bacterium]|nr:nodulation protein NfeD [Acidobacteriota bacterium]
MSRILKVIFRYGLLASVLLAGICWQISSQASPPASPSVIELRIDDAIHPIMVEHVERAFDLAESSNARLILITMDTPGGLDSSMREIIRRILHSKIPVAIYVSPSGTRAASAGFYLMESADIAAMSPGTATGAASPVFINPFSGTPIDLGETMKKKVMEDSAAFMRSIVEKRGRNVELAVKAVTEAKSWTEKEALAGKLIDIIANTSEELLQKLDGKTIKRFDGTETKLELAGAIRTKLEMTGRMRFLMRLQDPDVFFIMLIVGVLGLYTEFTHPGLFAPGAIGGICLILSLYTLVQMPVNLMGLLLIALALALFILEAKYTSHGVLGLAGAVAMVLGAMILIQSPMTGWGVSLGAAISVTLPFSLITIFLMRMVIRSRAWKPGAGAEQMLGAIGEVREAIVGPAGGHVFVRGELWRAVSGEPIPEGAQVRVVRIEGLTVHVEPVIEPATPALE